MTLREKSREGCESWRELWSQQVKTGVVLPQAGPLSWKRQALLFSSLQWAVGLEFSFGFPELDEKTFFFFNSKSSKLWELVAPLRLPQPSNLLIARGIAMAQHPPSYRTPVQHDLTLLIKQWHGYAMLRKPRFKNIKPLRKVFLLSPCFCSYY